ncbi:hypothetical protein T4B_4767 [Trichinella pseudospiralis]|uniref:Uncharacterized protein n=1 Tax=Trichinella pseudospiralis TaxID=6337 RepID=A0A0V1IHW0_TRIPS|nr:hypothetical protein T4B_4767 [Trichinella pseudospiralis]
MDDEGGGGGGGVRQDDDVEKESYAVMLVVSRAVVCRLVYCKVDQSVGRSVSWSVEFCYLALCIVSCIASAGKGKSYTIIVANLLTFVRFGRNIATKQFPLLHLSFICIELTLKEEKNDFLKCEKLTTFSDASLPSIL